VLRPTGDVDLDGVNKLRLSLLQCIKEKRANIVVNFQGIRYISYLGVGVLLERMRQCRTAGGDLRLSGLNLHARRTLQMASVESLFMICESETQALESFRQAA
jgi:anti-anti-sigma factor